MVSAIGYHATIPLTAKQVSAAQLKDKPYKLTDANRLYLYVAVSGTKSWRCNYRDGGKDKTKTFGQYSAMSLSDARMDHVKLRDLQDAPASDTAPTFKKVAEAWLKIKLPTLSNPKHQLQVAKTIEQYVYVHRAGVQTRPFRLDSVTQLFYHLCKGADRCLPR
ncbi:Arm DNA-binding domain-containing protein [Collimonas pratensis]|uniref:Arm DNA-binding domain-containing protein n=1 Tax=Collimonas pratensis TaxID=279113 RepID=UPI0018D3435E|nr:Arm DNA-binding domain-containing protein [Collimonas pratensis]